MNDLSGRCGLVLQEREVSTHLPKVLFFKVVEFWKHKRWHEDSSIVTEQGTHAEQCKAHILHENSPQPHIPRRKACLYMTQLWPRASSDPEV